uniref:Uncharacterized protein n=1 Tax=Ditylenchus dipsaci TaxID=166011 RepID=A0A915EB47_9BILA
MSSSLSLEQEQLRKKLQADPYFIPSVPMYCVLGQDMNDTIGDLFFDQHPNNFQPTPPRDFYNHNNKENQSAAAAPRERVKRASSVSRIPTTNQSSNEDPTQNGGVKPYPSHNRRSRSLIKPGRPSVAKKADPPAVECVENGGKKMLDHPPHAQTPLHKPSTTAPPPAAASSAFKTRAPVNRPNVFSTNRKPMSPPSSGACPSPMKLRSNVKKDYNSSSLREPMQNSDTQPPTNGHQDDNAAADITSRTSKMTIGEQPQMMPRRRSRSLIKPGRPSVANKMPAPAPAEQPAAPKPAEQRRSVGGKPVVLASMTSRTSIEESELTATIIMLESTTTTHCSTTNPGTMLICLLPENHCHHQLHLLRLSSGGSTDAASTPTAHRRVSNYMAPTLASSRRLTNTGNDTATSSSNNQTSRRSVLASGRPMAAFHK